MQIKNVAAHKLKIVHANQNYYLQIKYSTCKLKIVCKLKIENTSMQIKNEKSCARSMSDEELVRAVQPDLTAVGPFMFHVCNIFSLHVQFFICMSCF